MIEVMAELVQPDQPVVIEPSVLCFWRFPAPSAPIPK